MSDPPAGGELRPEKNLHSRAQHPALKQKSLLVTDFFVELHRFLVFTLSFYALLILPVSRKIKLLEHLTSWQVKLLQQPTHIE